MGNPSSPGPVELAGDTVINGPNEFQPVDSGINRYKSQMEDNPFKHDDRNAPPMPAMPQHIAQTMAPPQIPARSSERKRRDDPDAASVDFDDETSTHKTGLDKEGSLVPQPLSFVQAQAQRNANGTPPPNYTIVEERAHISTRAQ